MNAKDDSQRIFMLKRTEMDETDKLLFKFSVF